MAIKNIDIFKVVPKSISNVWEKTEDEISKVYGSNYTKSNGWTGIDMKYSATDFAQVTFTLDKDNGKCKEIDVTWFDCDKKEEKQTFVNIKSIKDCDNYLIKYPNSNWKEEVLKKKTVIQENTKKAQLAKERDQKIKTNSNTALWQLGYKVCRVYNNGYILGSLEQWNGDKSRVQIKIAVSPGGLNSEGEKLTKGNTIWINPKDGWHLALDEEKEYALNNDKSDEFEQFQKQLSSNAQNAKKGKFDIGTTVYYKTSSWFLNYKTGSYTIKASVEQWNGSFTKMQVKIIDTNYFEGTIDGQTIYKGSLIWVSPYSWE